MVESETGISRDDPAEAVREIIRMACVWRRSYNELAEAVSRIWRDLGGIPSRAIMRIEEAPDVPVP